MKLIIILIFISLSSHVQKAIIPFSTISLDSQEARIKMIKDSIKNSLDTTKIKINENSRVTK